MKYISMVAEDKKFHQLLLVLVAAFLSLFTWSIFCAFPSCLSLTESVITTCICFQSYFRQGSTSVCCLFLMHLSCHLWNKIDYLHSLPRFKKIFYNPNFYEYFLVIFNLLCWDKICVMHGQICFFLGCEKG